MGDSLFLRLGGRPAVGAIVDGLYDRLERDRELRRMFASRRSGERERQKLFFEGLFGGESSPYRDIGMQRRHAHRAISVEEADRWLAHFSDAMAARAIDARLTNEVMALLRGPALRLVNEGAPFEEVRAGIALAARGDIEALHDLLARFHDIINQRSDDGVTMLWAASRRGHLPVVRWLVERGADVELPGAVEHATSVMVTPYCIAREAGHGEVAAYLKTAGAQVDVFAAAYLGEIRLLVALLDGEPSLAGAVSPHEDFYDVTPLHYAVDAGRTEIARLLLERGAAARPYGRRLLTSAAARCDLEIVRLLLEAGAEAGEAENLGPLEDGELAIAKLLVTRGLDLDAPVRGRETFLTRACRGDKGEHPKAVQTLLDLGADVNARNGFGRAALHAAARAGFTTVIRVLASNGAELDAVDADGATALGIARAYKRATAVEALAEAGARLDVCPRLARRPQP